MQDITKLVTLAYKGSVFCREMICRCLTFLFYMKTDTHTPKNFKDKSLMLQSSIAGCGITIINLEEAAYNK